MQRVYLEVRAPKMDTKEDGFRGGFRGGGVEDLMQGVGSVRGRVKSLWK